MFNFGFAVEQLLGHVTNYQNLKHWTTLDTNVHPTWMPIEADKSDIWKHVPIVRSNWSLQASLRTRRAIQAVLRDQPLDALFLHTQTLALFAFPFMRQIPTIISTDSTPLNFDTLSKEYGHKVGGNTLLERQKFLWNRRSYHTASALVSWSQWTKDSLIADYGVPADKVMVIPPGVDLEQWHFKQEQTIDCPVRLLFVGGDFARKGGYALIEAFRTSLRRDCTLDIVTKDPKIAQELSGLESVQVHLNLTANSLQLKELYAKADIFVFPTQADCHSLVVMEAMAAGLPIVTTDVGAIRELVEAGVNGLLLPASDTGALVTALSALVGDESKRRSMAIASRRLAEERFDGRRNYHKILTLMKDLTEEHAASKRLSQNSLSPRL